MKELKTKIDIVLLIATIKSCNNEELTQLIKEYKSGDFEIV